MTATGLLTAATVAIAVARGTWVSAAGILVAVMLGAVALVILVRARAARATLLRRKRELGG
ncbi:hypothetical protein AB0M44_08950 [Streptosporangium subroseum]|uniref:hypothetical protein n=1 Tax=Streptosporangium subroseum TaxID=106412 RepID=UPI0034123ADC